jgi:hypothetical protein
MEKLHFEIQIKAPVEKVYKLMLEDSTYREWAAAFMEGSYFKGTWKEGSKILFLALKDGKPSGMVSRIETNIPNKFVSIEHLGMVQDDEEITSGPSVESWKGLHENYTFETIPEGSLLKVDMDGTDGGEMDAYFSETWPKALAILKEICER